MKNGLLMCRNKSYKISQNGPKTVGPAYINVLRKGDFVLDLEKLEELTVGQLQLYSAGFLNPNNYI